MRAQLLSLALAFIYTAAVPLSAQTVISSNDVAAAHTEQFKELDDYLDKLIADSAATRAESWKRDFSSIDAYEKSMAPKREELWRLLGGKPADAASLAPK